MKLGKKAILGGLALAAVAIANQASAVGTRSFVLADEKDFEGGDLEGVALDSTGRLQAGLNLGATAVSEAPGVWSVLRRPGGTLWLGTGNEGKLLEVKGATVTVLAETKALAVTSLAEAWGDSVVLGTLPDGKVMKMEGGKLSDLVTLKDTEHVWDVAFDKKSNVLYAATGPEGKLYRITQNGQAQVYYDAEEPHLMSVAVDSKGSVYVGASDKARLYKVTGPGRGSVLYDFGRTEVRDLVIGAHDEVFAIANDIAASARAPSRNSSTNPPGPNAGSGQKGKGILFKFFADGTPEELLDLKEEHLVSVTIGTNGQPYVGTGVEGRVYTVDTEHNSVLVTDTEERQVSALVLDGKEQYVVSSDPAVVHPVRGVGGPEATWTSKVLDAGLRAQFGRITWDASGTLELATRTGNTEDPDDTWSDWSATETASFVVKSPKARYLQVRARWSKDPTAVLREITIPFLTDNLRAVLTTVTATSPAQLEGSDGGLDESGGPISDDPDSTVKLKWTIDNPDKDMLRYRVQYRLLEAPAWLDLLKPSEVLTAENYSWDTSDFPEGRYRIRVLASDELSNPPENVKRHQLESGVVVVDNTAPTIEDLRINGRIVEGVALDGVGPIRRIEFSVAGSDQWYPFFPTDSIFDEQREEFRVDVSSVAPPGAGILTVRAFDSANNSVLRHLPLK